MIKIDFGDTYELLTVSADLSSATFISPQKKQEDILIQIEISQHIDLLLNNVYNLTFGPKDINGKINDKAKLKSLDNNKVLSTVLLLGISFLERNPDCYLGINGSTDARAYLYHWMVQTNRKSIGKYLIPHGVDWYVRLLRDNTIELDDSGTPFFKPISEPFDYERSRQNLYNYYIFELKF